MISPPPPHPPPPSDPPPAGGGADQPRRRREGWPGMLLFLAVTLAGLAGFFWHAASVYYLDIPMQSSRRILPRVLYWNDEKQPLVTSFEKTFPHPGMTRVRFPLRGELDVAHIRFDPTYSEGEVFFGPAVVRCSADTWLGYDIHYHDFTLRDYQPAHQIQTFEVKGDRVRLVTTPKADVAICFLALPTPLHLGFSAPAFARTFFPVAGVWTVLIVLDFLLLGARRAARRGLVAGWSRFTVWITDRLAIRAVSPPSRWERRTVITIYVLSTIWQVNAALHHGAMGQDYPTHMFHVLTNFQHPGQPWSYGVVDPPLFYFVETVIIKAIGNIHMLEVSGIFHALINLGALAVFYRLAQHFIAGPVVRTALLVLVAFLPLRLIHTVVFAPDAVVLPLFFPLAWVLVLIVKEETTSAQRRWLAVAAAGLLALGVLSKYVFLSSLIAVFLTVLQMARRRLVPWLEAVFLGLLSLALPAFTAWYLIDVHPDFAGDGAMQISLHQEQPMTFGDVFIVKTNDFHVLRAPPYDEPVDVHMREQTNGKPVVAPGPYELLMDHQYSYVALNHLGVFTDVLNIFQYDPTDNYYGQRNSRNQRLMALAVKTALPISICCYACMVALGFFVVGMGTVAPRRSRPDLEAVWLLAFGWFSNLVVFQPFVPNAYAGGYWMPRLTIPGLLMFLLFTAYMLERFIGGRTRTVLAWLVLGYVVLQSAIQAAFLWPWGVM